MIQITLDILGRIFVFGMFVVENPFVTLKIFIICLGERASIIIQSSNLHFAPINVKGKASELYLRKC